MEYRIVNLYQSLTLLDKIVSYIYLYSFLFVNLFLIFLLNLFTINFFNAFYENNLIHSFFEITNIFGIS